MSKTAKGLLPSLFLLLSACAHQANIPPQIQTQSTLPEIAAEFETTITPANRQEDGQAHTYRWRFWRSAKRVETHNLQDNSGEVWMKSPDTKISYERLFHDQKQVIEYMPGDLAAIGYATDWLAISTLLDQAMKAQLTAADNEEILGKPAWHYQSHDPEQSLAVAWMPNEQLPGLIKHTEQGNTVVTKIIALYPLAQSPWPYQRSGNYRYTDFADLGDKENDPFIKSIQHKIKAGHSH